MATQVQRARLCFSTDIGPEVTVDSLYAELEKLRASGRGAYRIQIDDTQFNDPIDVRSMQVFDAEQIVELTHS